MNLLNRGTVHESLSNRRFSRRAAVGKGAAGFAAGAAAVGYRSLGLAAPGRPDGGSPVTAGLQAEITADSVAAAIDALPTLIADAMDRTGIPGLAVGVVYQDEVAFLEGYGLRETGTSAMVDPDTVFQIASVSKSLASTVVAGVVGDGAANWDDPIVSHFPEFALSEAFVTREVTLRDMFCHRSGLPEHSGDLLEELGFDRATVLQRLRYVQPDYSFRAGYEYTNYGLTAAAVAAANAAEMEWEDLSKSRLYEPLGMTRTTSRRSEFLAFENRAKGHVLVDGNYVAKYVRDPDAESPAGGVSSTVRDLASWMRLQLGAGQFGGERVIDSLALGETHRPHTNSNPAGDPSTERTGFYGLGWNVDVTDQGQVRLSHSGAFLQGTGTCVQLLPAFGLGIVVLTNAAPIGVPEAMTFSFLDLATTGSVAHDYVDLFGQLFGQMTEPPYGTLVDYTQPPAEEIAAHSVDAYLGTYDNDYFGRAEIAQSGDGLVLRMGPAPMEFALSHYNGDVFSYQPVGESAYGLSGLIFTVDPDGQARSVLIENLNVHQQGRFSRASE